MFFNSGQRTQGGVIMFIHSWPYSKACDDNIYYLQIMVARIKILCIYLVDRFQCKYFGVLAFDFRLIDNTEMSNIWIQSHIRFIKLSCINRYEFGMTYSTLFHLAILIVQNVTKRLTENNYKQSPTKDVSINHIDKSGQQTRLIL